jgi:4'-phosphopantetheinyl transferase
MERAEAGAETPSHELGERVVHLWSVALDPVPEIVAELRALLSSDEIQRAERFRFDRHRRRFIVGRGALRSILGSYLGRSPAELEFEYGPKGKPSLAPSQGGDEFRFNLSHSSELGLYALARRQELGVDVEKLRPMPDAEQIAERFFSESERVALRAIPGEAKVDAFFNCWTRKEAYIKATGDGLSMPLDRFDVTLAPGEPAAMLRAEGGPDAALRWTLVHLDPAAGYVGALAIEGRDWQVQSSAWSLR